MATARLEIIVPAGLHTVDRPAPCIFRRSVSKPLPPIPLKGSDRIGGKDDELQAHCLPLAQIRGFGRVDGMPTNLTQVDLFQQLTSACSHWTIIEAWRRFVNYGVDRTTSVHSSVQKHLYVCEHKALTLPTQSWTSPGFWAKPR